MNSAEQCNDWFDGNGSLNISTEQKTNKSTTKDFADVFLDERKQEDRFSTDEDAKAYKKKEKNIERPVINQTNYSFDGLGLDETGFCFDLYNSLAEYENKSTVSKEIAFLDSVGNTVSMDFVSGEKGTHESIDISLDQEELATKEKILRRLEKRTDSTGGMCFEKEGIMLAPIENENLFFSSGEIQKKGEFYLQPGRHGRKTNKPPLSYATLIIQAIGSSPCGKMTLKQIYDWMKDSFPQYKFSGSAWQNSIRHNLSLNRCFKKVPKTNEEHGKGGFWCINKEFLAKQEALKECGMKPEPCTNRKTTSKRKHSPMEKDIGQYKTPGDCNKGKRYGGGVIKQKNKEGHFFQYNTEINQELDAVISEQFLYSELCNEKDGQRKITFVPYKR